MWLLCESATVEWRLLKNWEAYVKKRKGDEQVEKQMDVKKEKRGHIRALVLKVFTKPFEVSETKLCIGKSHSEC